MRSSASTSRPSSSPPPCWRSGSRGSPTCSWCCSSAWSRRGRRAVAPRWSPGLWWAPWRGVHARSPPCGGPELVPFADAGLGQQFLDSFTFMGNNLSRLLDDTLGTLELSGAALGVALAITLPPAVWLGPLHRGSGVAIRTANLGRSLPELALIAIFLAFFGIGFVNVMLALVIVGIPPILANAFTAVDGVEPDVVDAARGMGMSPLAVLLKVEIPLALPLMFAGIRTSVLFIIGASPLAAIAGGAGLGEIIVNQASYGFAGVLAASLWVSALALLIQGLFALLQRVLTPAGLKVGARAAGLPGGIDVGVADAERGTVMEANVA